MALKQGNECHTKWTHVENGHVMIRRIHRIEVQARNGRLYILTGNELPDFIQTCAGEGHKGKHLAQILLSPESLTLPEAYISERPWPAFRDVANVGMGMLILLLLKFAASLASAGL